MGEGEGAPLDKAGKGSGVLPAAGKGFLPLGRRYCLFPTPKSTSHKKKGNPDGSSRGMRAAEEETPPPSIIRP